MAPNRSARVEKKALTAAEAKEDARFDKSPFSSIPMVDLYFKGGDPLRIHRALLQRSPKLALLDPSKQYSGLGSPPPPQSLDHISRAAGHVLVHYLYSDSYQTLNWTGPTTGGDEAIAKLRTGFEVYMTARRLELPRLEELAKEQISLLSNDIDAFTIIDVVCEAYPTSTGNDPWFLTYMKTVIKTAFEDSEALSKSKSSENECRDDIPTAKIILRGAVETYQEMVETLAVKHVPVTPEKSVEPEPEPEPEPQPDADPVPTPQPSQQEYDVWAIAAMSKKSKKGKKKAAAKGRAIEPEPEPGPEPIPIQEPTPQITKDDDTTASEKTGGPSGVFGLSSTTNNPFGTKNKAAVSAQSGTAGGLFGASSTTSTPSAQNLFGASSTTSTQSGTADNAAAGAFWGHVAAISTTKPLFGTANNNAAVSAPSSITQNLFGVSSTASTPSGTTNNSVVGTPSSTAQSLFGASITTSTPFLTTTKAAVGAAPGTASPEFTPTLEVEDGRLFQSTPKVYFQNNLFMGAYKNWSSEELRLADYGRGQKQGKEGGGAGASGASLSG